MAGEFVNCSIFDDLGQRHKCWGASKGSHFGQERAEVRMIARPRRGHARRFDVRLGMRYAGQHGVARRRVRPISVRHRSNDAVFIGASREQWEQLADVSAGDGGGNGFEFAADLGSCGGLRVPCVVLWRPASQEQYQTALGAAKARRGHRLRRRGQAKSSQCSEAQEIPSRWPAAEAANWPLEREHREPPDRLRANHLFIPQAAASSTRFAGTTHAVTP